MTQSESDATPVTGSEIIQGIGFLIAFVALLPFAILAAIAAVGLWIEIVKMLIGLII